MRHDFAIVARSRHRFQARSGLFDCRFPWAAGRRTDNLKAKRHTSKEELLFRVPVPRRTCSAAILPRSAAQSEQTTAQGFLSTLQNRVPHMALAAASNHRLAGRPAGPPRLCLAGRLATLLRVLASALLQAITDNRPRSESLQAAEGGAAGGCCCTGPLLVQLHASWW